MNQFLMKETFDPFLLMEAVIVVANTYSIDGRIQKSFFTQEEWEDESLHPYEFTQWKDIRPMVFQMIKGKHTPVSMKLVMMLRPEETDRLLAGDAVAESARDTIKGLVCNVKYENGSMTITTGVSYEGFSMDKTPEKIWDQHMKSFLGGIGIDFEEL